MPLPPLPDNNTSVIFCNYTVLGEPHSFQWRYTDPPATLADATERVASFLQELQPLMANGWTVTGLEVRFEGEIFTLPAGTLNVTPGAGTALLSVNAPRFVSFIGRGALGRKWRLSLYGLQFTLEDDYRLEVGDEAALDAARAVIDASPLGTCMAIDRSKVNTYAYYNVGYNAYHQREARG